ncbi:hypothetical protein A3K73_06575 [Candidatus Pacearchaeota archaeon RBG_13_36_9]|nr:MAG: hypothetical protein A3K73_06575 [Candidatus Pacearchaeota archaeon RBG_13_36_9]
MKKEGSAGKIKILFKDKRFRVAALVLIVGILVNQVTSWYIKSKYTSLPILNDIITDNIPYLNLVWLYDLLSLLSLISFIVYAYKKDFEKAPFFLMLFGISQLVRGIFIGLTPFGSPKLDSGLFKGSMFREGIYPSGHTGFSFLAFLLSEGKMKVLFLILTILIVATLLIARGHYSIDIFSAIIFNYAIYEFGNRCFKNFRIKR